MFEDFIKSGKVRQGQKDVALAKALIEMSQRQISFVSSIKITEENASPLLVNYYEALREICEALCALEGYKVYSHEAFTSYLKEKLGEEQISFSFDRLRKLRNGINYYGKTVNKAETEGSSKEVLKLIKIIKKKYLNEYKI